MPAPPIEADEAVAIMLMNMMDPFGEYSDLDKAFAAITEHIQDDGGTVAFTKEDLAAAIEAVRD